MPAGGGIRKRAGLDRRGPDTTAESSGEAVSDKEPTSEIGPSRQEAFTDACRAIADKPLAAVASAVLDNPDLLDQPDLARDLARLPGVEYLACPAARSDRPGAPVFHDHPACRIDMFRFIHSSDLHLGKRFGQFTGDLPGRLREARHGVIGRLAQHAREHGADTILLAGDTFDTETPAPDVRRQALAAMRDHAPVRWVVLPGNHDSLQAAQLWAMLKAEAPENVILATEPVALPLSPQVALLPAPCTTRRPGRDMSEWMDGATTPEGTLRLGLAHGAIRDFSEEGATSDVIAPDRAARAGLDYLALGDWHGALVVDPRTRYSGTPEPDRFKHRRPGEALLVSIAGRSALPEVSALATASFDWQILDLHLLDGDDPVQVLEALLPESRRRETLLQLVATGRSRLPGRTAMTEAAARSAPDFAFLELDDSGLTTECEAGDLDLIDRAGALREAAAALLAEAESERHSAGEREIARAALARLFSYAQAVTP